MKYSIVIGQQAEKSLSAIPLPDRQRIIKRIDDLADNPHPLGCKKLTGNGPDLFRIRQGNYRVIYSIDDNKLIVRIIDMGHRKNIYA